MLPLWAWTTCKTCRLHVPDKNSGAGTTAPLGSVRCAPATRPRCLSDIISLEDVLLLLAAKRNPQQNSQPSFRWRWLERLVLAACFFFLSFWRTIDTWRFELKLKPTVGTFVRSVLSCWGTIDTSATELKTYGVHLCLIYIHAWRDRW